MTFKPTFLYVKTHNITGLKYFGKTIQDPMKYMGSGKYWSSHLRVHGNDVSTEVIGFFEDEVECKRTALQFSQENDIVKSDHWANLKEENGTDGWQPGPMSEETKAKLRKPKPEGFSAKVRAALMGHPVSPESIKKISDKNRGRVQTIEHRKKNSEANSGEKNGNFGRLHTEEERTRMSQNRGGKGLGNRNGVGSFPRIKCELCGRLIGSNRLGYHKKFCKEI